MIRVPLDVSIRGAALREWAALLASTAGRFESGIMIKHGSVTVNAKSMLGLLTAISSSPSGNLVLVADGPDEGEAVRVILSLTRDDGIKGGSA